MIPTSKGPHKWPVPWRLGESPAPVFYFRAASVIERSEFEAELAGEHRAAQVFPWELHEAFEAGLTALLGEDAEGIADLVQLAAQERGGEDLGPEETARLDQARDLIEQHWPPYRRLLSQAKRRNAVAPVLAFQWFCAGWEGQDVEFATGFDGKVKPELLTDLDAIELRGAGLYAFNLQYMSSAEKNSGPPLNVDADPKTSGTARPSRADGKSATTSGPKTH